ncbi:hypothetical protein GCM10010287_36700 [Streptomyces variabilis]|uniref:ATP/GTP-binding protein n=1 Tax=Streptomyces variabilis TaxID=67372 RepID=A0ABQ2U025_9ACTN|nr:TniB family NTP-binding protein [Streptomyces variabilis]GGP78864.1 hypothetical protein GCM10010265_66180 [Streptomyces griseoincarnatus]GGT59167.1 hypothetical protein GCM10010287_36700 [Streptomyces variabilis]
MASVTAFADFDNEDSEEGPFLPISTWQGWKDFVGTLRLEAPPADDPSWSTQDLEDYHSRFVVMTTPSMKKVSLQLRRLLVLNRRQQGTARRGLIVSGPPTTGKTTTLMELGRIFEHTDRRRHPCLKDRLPVAFVSVPPSATPKMLVSEFARFLGIPVHARMNQAQITDAVCHVLAEKATQLVFVDDVHLLNTRTRTGAETADQMKHLGERIAATFVYAGVDVEHSPLLTGPRGAQIAGRFSSTERQSHLVRQQPASPGSTTTWGTVSAPTRSLSSVRTAWPVHAAISICPRTPARASSSRRRTTSNACSPRSL